MAEQTVELHPLVKDIAAQLELKAGKLEMSDRELAKNRARMVLVKNEEKKDVLVSLVALGAKLMRESKEGTAQAVQRLMDLAAGLIGDPDKAKALFAQMREDKKKG